MSKDSKAMMRSSPLQMSNSAVAVMSWLAGATAVPAMMMMLDPLLVKQATGVQQRKSAAPQQQNRYDYISEIASCFLIMRKLRGTGPRRETCKYLCRAKSMKWSQRFLVVVE
jgi:hypothetical protein